jgi:short-subunit dehydrogenase
MRSLSGARVWLTGASSGIGEALVPPLLRRGARVAVSARRAERLEALAQRWRANGGEVLVVPLDATDRPAVLAAARRIEEAWGGIDVAIFNAGTHTPSTSDGFDSAQFVDTMTLNYFGVIYGIEAVLPAMLARGSGHIVGVASLAGYRALPRAPAYGASKAALILALDSIRFDLEPRGITVTTVNPGFVKTPLTDKNTFKMPFLMDVEDAAAIMVRDIERQKRESHFPVPFSWMLKLLRILPFPLYRLLILRGTRGQQRARRSVIGDL